MDLFTQEERKEIISNARKGSLKEIIMLARFWSTLSLSDGIQSIFFHHLNSSEVPTTPETYIDLEDPKRSMDDDTLRAFWSLWGVGQLSAKLPSLASDPYGHEIVEAWPGIFKWSAFLYTSRIQISREDYATTPALSKKFDEMRSTICDVIASAWCAVAYSASAKRAMLNTHGVVDIATRLWLFEDDPAATRDLFLVADGLPVGSMLLEILSEGDGDKADAEKIISAAGGDLDLIAKTSLNRLKCAISSPEFFNDPLDAVFILNLIRGFCQTPRPEITETFLKNGAIPICAKLLTRIARVLNTQDHNEEEKASFLQLMKMGFWFFYKFLDATSGVPWVIQAIHAGLLTAFVECSPFYYDMEHEDFLVVLISFTEIIPTYLAYYSVVQAMDAAFLKLEETKAYLSIRKSRAWPAFNSLAFLTARRFGVNEYWVKHLKRNAVTCHNPICDKLDVRDNFRKCGKCGSVVYCSKECQAIHWKEFGHKRRCKVPSKTKVDIEDRYSGDGGIPTRDFNYIQSLNVFETRYNLPYLKRLAAEQYPGVALHDLIIIIGYDQVPIAYDLCLASEWADKIPEHRIPRNVHRPVADASCTLLLAMIPYGKTPRLVVTQFTNGIWDLDRNPFKGGEVAPVDPTGNRIVDWVDKEAEVKRKQYCGV